MPKLRFHDENGRLEGKPPAVGVADFVQVGVAGKLDHWRRSTHQDESVVTWRWQVFPHHVFIDEALAVLPAFRCSVYGEPQLEPVRVVDLDLFQLWSQQDVFLSLVGKQQVTHGLVLWILHHSCNELQHGSDPCPSSDHAHMFGCLGLSWGLLLWLDCKNSFAFVNKETTGSSEVNGVIDPEALQVLTHLPPLGEFRMNVLKVNLHHQVHKAFVIITGHWCVWTDNQLPVYSCRQIDVLPDRETEDVFRGGQCKAELPCVMADNLFVEQPQCILDVGVL